MFVFPDFSQTTFSLKLEKLLIKTGKKDERCDSTKFLYFLNLCRYSCNLPDWNQESNQFIKHYEQSLLDVELKTKMESLGTLRSSQFTVPLFPIAVPNDNVSFYNAISMALWGINDNHGILKQVTEHAIPQMADALFTRWQIWRPSLKDPKSLWHNIQSQIEEKCPLSPDNAEDYFSLIIFVLSNVIQRPIIVIDCSSSSMYATAFPLSLTSDLQGVYLPLEKPPASCCKVPVFICHESIRFSPLMFPMRGYKAAKFPLINGDLASITVRYLNQGANPEMILRQYLNIEEINLESNNKSMRSLLCICSEINILPEDLNPMLHHFKRCKEIFDKYISSQKTETHVLQRNEKLSPQSTQPLLATNCFQFIDDKSQTKVVSTPATTSSKSQTSSSLMSTSLLTVHPLTSSTKSSAVKSQGLDTKVKTFKSPMQKSPLISPDSSQQLSPQHRYVICPANEDFLSEMNVEPHLPSASNAQRFQEETNGVGFLDSSLASRLSLMNESCHRCSFYLCSDKTYPYCHECSNRMAANQNTNKTPFDQQRDADSTSVFHNVNSSKYQKEMIPQQQGNSKGESQIDAKQYEGAITNRLNKTKRQGHKGKKAFFPFSHQRQLFCHSHGCHNLKQIDSRLCFQCLLQSKDSGTGLKEITSQSPSIVTSNSKKIDQSHSYAQAECLSPCNDDDNALIEISEAPLRKCVSDVCQNLVSTHQSLCERCLTILTEHAMQTAKPEESTCLVKHANENEQGEKSLISQFDSHSITRPPMLMQECFKKTHSKKVNLASDRNNQKSNQTLRTVNKNSSSADKKVESSSPESLNRMKTGKAEVEMKKLPSPYLSPSESVHVNPILNPIVSKHSHLNASGIDTIIHHPHSRSQPRTIEREFHNLYTQLTNEQRKGVSKCRTVSCENFGNKQKDGFCNACFSGLFQFG